MRPTGCEVMRSSWPHSENGLGPWIQAKKKKLTITRVEVLDGPNLM
jgi:hypothetical protein